MPTNTTVGRRKTAVLLVLSASAVLNLVLLLLVSCSSDPPDPGPTADARPRSTTTSTTEPPATTTTTRPPTPEQEVEAALLGIVERHYRRLEKPNPDDPTIADDFEGAALLNVVARNRELRDAGMRDDFSKHDPPIPAVETIEMASKRQASVTTCTVDDVLIVMADSRAVVNDEVGSYRLASDLRLSHGRWRLHDQAVISRWDDGKGCDR